MCQRCRHVFWHTMPTENELYEYYSRQYTESHHQSEIQQSKRDYYRSHVRQMCQIASVNVEELVVADIGCSLPVLMSEAIDMGAQQAIGVDWSLEARDYGVERGVAVLTPIEFTSQVPDESLNVLRYSHCLEHTINPLQVLKEQVKKVRDNGIVYITQPNIPTLRFGNIEAPFDCVYPTHLHYFTPASLVVLFEAAGCVIERFFTTAQEDEVEVRHGPYFDEPYATAALRSLKDVGESLRGIDCNYPKFFGRNSGAWGRKVSAASTRRGGMTQALKVVVAD
jgi:2-polyprenyl-3-methyl-5-hydroxy-6-metoxy-1,4-benzoquinol methylase